MRILALLGGVLALFAVVRESAGASSPPGPLSLKETVGFALAHSPVFDTAIKTQTINELQYKSAVFRLLPSLDFTTTDGFQNNIAIASTSGSVYTPNSTSPWSSSLSLGITENLYDNGVSLTRLGIADRGRDLASLASLKNRDTLTLDIATEFYRYSLAIVLLEVRREQQTILDKQFKTLTSQYQQGFKPKSDYLRIKTQVQRAEIDRISAENDISQSVANLHKLLGVDYKAVAPPAFEPVQVKRDQKAEGLFSDRAPDLENFYDYRMAKVQEEINDKNVQLVRRNYWPQLSATAGATYSNQSYLNSNTPFAEGHQLSWSALVTLQYNLWDWGIRRRDVQIAEFNRDIQENTITSGLLDLHARITGLMASLTRIGKSYKLSLDLLALEEESNRNLTLQYREGKGTYLDLITSLNSLLDAKIQFYTSYFAALTGAAQYKYYEGKIYEELVEK